jgi:hypothetical protein
MDDIMADVSLWRDDAIYTLYPLVTIVSSMDITVNNVDWEGYHSVSLDLLPNTPYEGIPSLQIQNVRATGDSKLTFTVVNMGSVTASFKVRVLDVF